MGNANAPVAAKAGRLLLHDRACPHHIRSKNSMMQGYVRHWIGEKGFGFIHSGDNTTDVFVHVSAVERAAIAY